LNDDKLKYLNQLQDLYDDEIFISYDNKEINQTNFKINDNAVELDSQRNEIKNCLKCNSDESIKTLKLGSGDPNAGLLIIGEIPGEREDLSVEPFLETAGKLLDKMLKAIDMSRDKNVFICNVLNCKTTEKRNLKKKAIDGCELYLLNQIDLIKPKLIVALGRNAGKTLLGVEKSLKEMRGILHEYHSKRLIVTYHPVTLLRNPSWKSEAWEDFKWIRKLLMQDR